jgi:L-lysine 2,3-aminomutase
MLKPEGANGGARVVSAGERRTMTDPVDMLRRVPTLSQVRLEAARTVEETFAFRVPAFYAANVLLGTPDDPLLDIVFPSAEELADGEELWDATPSPYRASDSRFWIQKYEYQGLIRTTTVCSGLCRFCYLKKKNAEPAVMTVQDVDRLFDDLDVRGGSLREIILSGGDPLCAPAEVLGAIGARMQRYRAKARSGRVHITVHTREPVWDPPRLLRRRGVLSALASLQPKTYMINVLHPREVTPEFMEACAALAEAGGPGARPALLCQHPLFRGVNDSVEILEDLYDRLFRCSPPVLPYYLVHPFYNGTLPKHRLTILESQRIYRELVRRPGCITPRLVVPTPHGKCLIGPNEQIQFDESGYVLKTKDGEAVLLP